MAGKGVVLGLFCALAGALACEQARTTLPLSSELQSPAVLPPAWPAEDAEGFRIVVVGPSGWTSLARSMGLSPAPIPVVGSGPKGLAEALLSALPRPETVLLIGSGWWVEQTSSERSLVLDALRKLACKGKLLVAPVPEMPISEHHQDWYPALWTTVSWPSFEKCKALGVHNAISIANRPLLLSVASSFGSHGRLLASHSEDMLPNFVVESYVSVADGSSWAGASVSAVRFAGYLAKLYGDSGQLSEVFSSLLRIETRAELKKASLPSAGFDRTVRLLYSQSSVPKSPELKPGTTVDVSPRSRRCRGMPRFVVFSEDENLQELGCALARGERQEANRLDAGCIACRAQVEDARSIRVSLRTRKGVTVQFVEFRVGKNRALHPLQSLPEAVTLRLPGPIPERPPGMPPGWGTRITARVWLSGRSGYRAEELPVWR